MWYWKNHCVVSLYKLILELLHLWHSLHQIYQNVLPAEYAIYLYISYVCMYVHTCMWVYMHVHIVYVSLLLYSSMWLNEGMHACLKPINF